MKSHKQQLKCGDAFVPRKSGKAVVKTQPLLILLALGGLVGCGGNGNDSNSLNSPKQPGNRVSNIELDASAGGVGVAPNDPANKYTYFNLDRGQVVALTDSESSTSVDWHIAFKHGDIKLNGGASGPGSVKGAVADAQADFYDGSGKPNGSIFLNASAEDELAAFNGIIHTNGLSYAADRKIPAITGDGSSGGWWFYSDPSENTVSANTEQWWLLKSVAADRYAKFHVTALAQDSRNITLELFIQGTTDNAFSATPTIWTTAIGANGGSQCYDIDAAAGVDCTAATTDWDLKVDVTDQHWNIWTNSGVSGSGNGGAYGPFDANSIAGYVSGTAGPGDTDVSGMYRQDSSGGVFKDNTWYADNLQGNHKWWPNYRVYAIDTGTATYKLQLLGYYNAAGASGHITLRYSPILNIETVNVTLEEWGISLDKSTVRAGNVNFRVTNRGPADAHEFVVIKTDLAPDALPADLQGVDETGMDIVGEIEGMRVGAEVHVTSMDLAPGNYVLICNIWDASEQESHYHEGMRVRFTVTVN